MGLKEILKKIRPEIDDDGAELAARRIKELVRKQFEVDGGGVSIGNDLAFLSGRDRPVAVVVTDGELRPEDEKALEDHLLEKPIQALNIRRRDGRGVDVTFRHNRLVGESWLSEMTSEETDALCKKVNDELGRRRTKSVRSRGGHRLS